MATEEITIRPRSPVTQLEVAQAAGVSLATAALALNAHPRVSAKTRERVVEVANRLGFVANAAARRLVRQRGHSRAISFEQVGLIYVQRAGVENEQTFLSMLGGLEHELSQMHALLILVRISEPADWNKIQRLTRLGGVDGWLVLGSIDDMVRERLQQTLLPYVIIGDHRCSQPVHNVNVDHAAAASMAVHHLASLGHRRIAYLAGSMKYVYQRQMLNGYLQAVQKLCLDTDEKLIAPLDVLWSNQQDSSGTGNVPNWIFTEQRHPQNVECMKRWLEKLGALPTALVTQEFDWAFRICRILRDAGLKVPENISVIGYETESRFTQEQGMTRVASPMMEVGRHGARLLRQIATEQGNDSSDIKLLPQLIEGWSTGALTESSSHRHTQHFHLEGYET